MLILSSNICSKSQSEHNLAIIACPPFFKVGSSTSHPANVVLKGEKMTYVERFPPYLRGLSLATSTTIIQPLMICINRFNIKTTKTRANSDEREKMKRRESLSIHLAIHLFESSTSSLLCCILYKCIALGPFGNFVHYDFHCQ